ncbi:MAG: hypothetical protein AAGG38_15310, partial [Planctomycetota bacterium]
MATLSLWQRVADDPDLLAAADAIDPGRVADLARLRKHHPPDAVAVAVELLAARRKAAVKFPGLAPRLLADVPGVEQATPRHVADHKAQRFRRAGLTHLADVCCGIGGDSLGFAAAGLDVLAVDRDPVRAWMAGHNARCPARVADAETFHEPDRALHLDPARRVAGRRVSRLADHLPPPPVLRRLLDRHPHAAVKLSPAVDLDDLAQQLPPGDLEFISDHGRLVQAALYTGRLRADPDRPPRHFAQPHWRPPGGGAFRPCPPPPKRWRGANSFGHPKAGYIFEK